MARFKKRSIPVSVPPVAEPAVAEPAEPKADEVILVRDMALGNGTRKRGFLIGTTTGLLDEIIPAAGVDPIEIENIRRNPHLVVLAPPE